MERRRLLEALLMLLPLLALPALLFGLSRGEEQFVYPGQPQRMVELVITSPQWEGIKVEMEEGFKRWLFARDGTGVDIKWLDHGGGTKTLRWIQEQFQHSPDGIGVDIMFGGGTDPYDTLKRGELLMRYEPPAELLDPIPESVAGFSIYDTEHYWHGTALTGFGIMINRGVFRWMEGLRGMEVRDWEDLTDPRLFGWVGAADPRGSSSYHTSYEILLQAYGFDRGLVISRLMGANISSYMKYSAEIPKSCAIGQVACAATIDHYARAQIEKVGPVIEFRMPAGKTLVNADAVGILAGAPNAEVARRFVDFLLSREAGLLWMLRRGEPGGPRRHALNRASIRPELFEETAGRSDVAENPFNMEQSFRYDDRKASARWTILNDFLGALVIDTHGDLKQAVLAWRALDGERKERATRLLFENPLTEEEMLEMAETRWREDPAFRERMRIEWTGFARSRYRAVIEMGEQAGLFGDRR